MMRSLKQLLLVGMEDFLALWQVLLQAQAWLTSTKAMEAPPRPPRVKQQQQQCRPVEEACLLGRHNDSILSSLNGTLLRSTCSFPYLFVVAFEAGGGLPRALLLLLAYPLACLAQLLVSRQLAMRILILVSLCGVRESRVVSVARAVLPKFYMEDLHPQAYRLLVACGRRYVVTSTPRLLVESFLKDFVGVEHVVGTELHVTRGGYLTGLLLSSSSPTTHSDVLLGCRKSFFSSFCKEWYIVKQDEHRERHRPLRDEELLKPLVFHDGRLAIRPTPAVALAIMLWLPLGLPLAICRGLVAVASPSVPLIALLEAILGIRIRMRGHPPASAKLNGRGVLFVCTHRMLVDPLFLSLCANRRVMAVTYSISRVSELLAPIRTMRLTRCRTEDARAIRQQLERGDLVLCPEGTTCREPYLLRFSPLFAELSDVIVPVAINTRSQFFYGSTVRGWKSLDSLFFLLNPFPVYDVHFLEQVPPDMTCSAGKSGIEVANYVQQRLAGALGFQCTNYTRKDKYRILAGNDGLSATDCKQ